MEPNNIKTKILAVLYIFKYKYDGIRYLLFYGEPDIQYESNIQYICRIVFRKRNIYIYICRVILLRETFDDFRRKLNFTKYQKMPSIFLHRTTRYSILLLFCLAFYAL